jgi:hypothetical protein
MKLPEEEKRKMGERRFKNIMTDNFPKGRDKKGKRDRGREKTEGQKENTNL